MNHTLTLLAIILFSPPTAAADNELTEKEKAEGWVLLFDGKTLDGWTTSAGKPSGSTNPIVDYHLVYAIALIVAAAAYAGHTWGLGRRWARIPLVQKHRWLI